MASGPAWANLSQMLLAGWHSPRRRRLRDGAGRPVGVMAYTPHRPPNWVMIEADTVSTLEEPADSATVREPDETDLRYDATLMSPIEHRPVRRPRLAGPGGASGTWLADHSGPPPIAPASASVLVRTGLARITGTRGRCHLDLRRWLDGGIDHHAIRRDRPIAVC